MSAYRTWLAGLILTGLTSSASAYSHDREYVQILTQKSEMSSEDKAYIKKHLNRTVTDRVYWRGSVGQAEQTIGQFKNRAPNLGAVEVTKTTDLKSTNSHWSAALGYRFQNWNWEAEFFHPKTTRYVSSPVLASNATYDFESKISTNVLFNNFSRHWPLWRHVETFMGFGIGGVLKTTNTELSSGTTGERKISHLYPAGQVMLGLKAQITHHWGVALTGKAMTLGTIRMGPAEIATSVKIRADDHTLKGTFINVYYRYAS